MAITLTIKVVPQSGRQKLVWDEKQQVLKCYLKSAPEKNKANDELCRVLRKKLGIPLCDIAIIGGHTARRKVIRLTTLLARAQVLQQAGINEVGQQSVWS